MLKEVAMLDAEPDLQRKTALDRPPRVDIRAAIREANSLNQGLGWVGNLLAAVTGPGKLTQDEFFYYGLHRPEITRERARSYVGKKIQARMHTTCNDVRWFAPCHDKALFYTILDGAGFPAPETVAILSPQSRCGYECAPLDALESTLRGATFPLFAKPIDGMYSIGAMIFEGIDNAVSVRGHGDIPEKNLADYMHRVSPSGYLLQRILSPHPDIADLVDAVPSLRLLVIASEAPTLLSAVVKLPAASSVADNFWRSGNVLGAVEDGRISRAIVSRGAQPPAEDPDLVGRTLPGWDEAAALVLQAAMLFPAIRTQSWDVALTDRGPVLLEFNFGGDLNLHQLSHDRGILTDEFRDHLRRCGYKRKLQ